MSTFPLLLADEDTEAILAAWRRDPAVVERFMIFGAIGLVTVLVLLWAVFLRKKRRRRSHHHHGHHRSSGLPEFPWASQTDGAPPVEEKRRHQRHSRRRRRRRNPTLAETGGLPPIRPEDEPQPEP